MIFIVVYIYQKGIFFQNHFKYDCATENPGVTKSCSLLVRCRRTYVLNKHDMFMQYEKFSA